MKTYLFNLLAIILFFNSIKAQNSDLDRNFYILINSNVRDKYGKVVVENRVKFPLKYNKLVVFENDVVTVVYNRPKTSIDSSYVIRLDSLSPSLGHTSTCEQAPKIDIEGDTCYFVFTLSNLKISQNYHFRIVQRKNPSVNSAITLTKTNSHIDEVTKDTTITNTTITKDSVIVKNESAMLDFIVEAHERTFSELTIGGYFWPNFHFPNYTLVNNIIRDNGPSSSSGLIIGGIIFPWGTDQNSLWNFNMDFWRNVSRKVGLFGGLGFSNASKGIDNLFFGVDISFLKFNLLFGLNQSKVNTLVQGYTVNTYYNNSNNDFNNIISSKYIYHLFFGSSIDIRVFGDILANLIGAVIGL